MLYNATNAAGAKVFDMDARQELRHVMAINTRQGWVKVAPSPLKLDAQGRIAGERIRFGSIYAIQGLEPRPCLFHCYGRLPS